MDTRDLFPSKAIVAKSKGKDEPASMNQYIYYLTSKNSLFYSLRQHLKSKVKLEIIEKSNSKSLALVD